MPIKIKIPAILALVAPYLSVASGAVASWLFVHLHFLGIFHVGQAGVQQAIYGAVVFGITAILTYLVAHFHWLPLVTAKYAPEVHGVHTVAPHSKTAVGNIP